MPNIESWSHESPKLYTIALRIQHEGRFTDYTTLKIGFRDVQFSDKGHHDQRASRRDCAR
ncbi:MAG: hypothetical protein ACLR8Y_13980 [Alistipes indistinctus]